MGGPPEQTPLEVVYQRAVRSDYAMENHSFIRSQAHISTYHKDRNRSTSAQAPPPRRMVSRDCISTKRT